jgi:hypothetical protein
VVWWVKLIIMVVASYVAAALAPKPPQPKPASLDDLDVPQADEGRAVGMVFGHVFIKAPTLAWFGNLTTEKIKKRTGNIFGHTKTTVGFRYKMGLHFALCRSLDMLYEIIVGERVAWRGPLAASAEDHIGQWELFGGDKKEGGVEGYFDFMLGDAAQGQNAYLLGQLGDPLPAFRGVVSVVFKGGRVTANTPYVKPWWFRCERVYATHNGSPQWYEEKAAVPMVSFTPPASATSMLIEYGNFDVDAVTNSATTADGMKLVAAYDLQTVFDTDVVYLWPAYNGLYLGLSSWGIPAYSGPGTGSMYRTAVVKNDEHTISGFGPGGPYDGYQAAFDAAVASAPYTLTGATRYRFGNVDDPFLDNTGGASWYFETWRDSTTTYNAMNPAHILRECLTDPYMRMNYPESMIDDESFETAADTFHTEGMGLCLFWSNQTTVREFIQTVLDHCGAVYYADPFTGKFVLKAIRGDYDVGALEEFDESSIINVESFERSGPGEVVNEISVQYFDISTGKDAVITVQDLASINSQGAIVAETRQYPGLSHPALAARVAQRDLTASTASLARIKVRFTRKAATIRPGDVIKFSWAKLGLTSLICRVMDVSYGGLNNGEIRAELAEDVFGLPSSSYQEEQPGGWDVLGCIP